MPDSPETRLRLLEATTAKLQQQMEDTQALALERSNRHESDVRVFAPLVADVATHEVRLTSLELAVVQGRESLASFQQQLEQQRASKLSTRIAIGGLVIATIGMTATLVSVLVGLIG